mgnify:CR=1 FL=1
MKIRFNRWGMSVCWLFMAACANIVPPDGGEKDIQPPKLVSQSLKDSLLSVKPNQLSLQFDEYITVADAQKEITMSPSIDAPLTVSYTYKKITVSLPDSVLLSTCMGIIFRYTGLIVFIVLLFAIEPNSTDITPGR